MVGGLEHFLCFSIYWKFHHPNWLSYFSEGWLNHQPVIFMFPSFLSAILKGYPPATQSGPPFLYTKKIFGSSWSLGGCKFFRCSSSQIASSSLEFSFDVFEILAMMLAFCACFFGISLLPSAAVFSHHILRFETQLFTLGPDCALQFLNSSPFPQLLWRIPRFISIFMVKLYTHPILSG